MMNPNASCTVMMIAHEAFAVPVSMIVIAYASINLKSIHWTTGH